MSSRLQPSTISPFRSRKSPSSSSSAARPKTPSALSRTKLSNSPRNSDRAEAGDKGKENVTVTVRFRPLSAREISKGDEIAWYADGDYAVRYEYNANTVYGFDRVFGPATTTRHVYDVAAQDVISGAMKGINGTVFAYGVTSSGKTHTMHGEQKSPGIIPLAVKDVFGIIQELPGREFLLRVSYLEIYNEVINDLLDPTGQNLRIREDAQGTYVEGIKEEVVLSPAHALSLIASGEEHRHVGSNNVNLFSSRSHTIFTLTVESSPRSDSLGEEDVTLSQLHLIDLAGSESSKTETSGLRRKEGSYINKSLLTLGTVISKLTDGKASHVPYRDSKLTRLLQSSLSGHGRVSLICTVTPASSNCEETHNTLKFAHRSKYVETKASQNKIMDEKSLIKKYQTEISSLKQELQRLKSGMKEDPITSSSNQENLLNLKLELEAGQMKLQSRLEEEEQAKAALMGRIQRLTKLILVSTKNSMPSNITQKSSQRRRHSFGEDELAYLPERKRENLITDYDTRSIDSEITMEGQVDMTNIDELVNEYKCNRRQGMLGWFKLKKPKNAVGVSPSATSDSSKSGSPAPSSKSSQNTAACDNFHDCQRNSVRKGDYSSVNNLLSPRQAVDLFSGTMGKKDLSSTGTTIIDQMDLFREQMKVLAGEVALSTSSLKRLSDQAASTLEDKNFQDQMLKLKNEISNKKRQMRMLEQCMIESVEMTQYNSTSTEMFQALSKLATQLNENLFELEVKSADNRILQEQLQMKTMENAELKDTIFSLRRQLDASLKKSSSSQQHIGEYIELKRCANKISQLEENRKAGIHTYQQYDVDDIMCTNEMSLNMVRSHEESNSEIFLNSKLLMQAADIENLKQDKVTLTEEKDGLKIQSQKSAEEASYAKELASAAAVELRNLTEEVAILSYQNAILTGDLAFTRKFSCPKCCRRSDSPDVRKHSLKSQSDSCSAQPQNSVLVDDLLNELCLRCQKEVSLEAAFPERDRRKYELLGRFEETKRHEEALDNELVHMWEQNAKMRGHEDVSPQGVCHSCLSQNQSINGFPENSNVNTLINKEITCQNFGTMEEGHVYDDACDTNYRLSYLKERTKCEELNKVIARLKGENVNGLDISTLEDLQNLHLEAITNICHAKVNYQVR
uniref:Kinesin motor domain-containing protein n=1 Tax=Kalanchoe fedtschenkoi TaxID=63787 RepID=A0A7N0US93_KALFE